MLNLPERADYLESIVDSVLHTQQNSVSVNGALCSDWQKGVLVPQGAHGEIAE